LASSGLVAKNAAVITHPISGCTVVGENTCFAFNAEDLPSGMKHYAVFHRLSKVLFTAQVTFRRMD